MENTGQGSAARLASDPESYHDTLSQSTESKDGAVRTMVMPKGWPDSQGSFLHMSPGGVQGQHTGGSPF